MAIHLGAVAQGIHVGRAGFQQAVGDDTPVDLDAGRPGQLGARAHAHGGHHEVGADAAAVVETDHHALVRLVHRSHQRAEMKLRALGFQCRLHRLAGGLRQQGGQAVPQGIDRLDLKAAVEQVVGKFATDKPAAYEADLLHIVLFHRGAEIIVIQQVVHRVHQLQAIPLDRRLDDVCPHRQHQLAVVDGRLGVAHLDKLLRGIDLVDPGHGPDTGLEHAGHAAGIELGQVVGIVILGEAGGQHGLGVGAAIVRGDQDQRRVLVVLAKLLGQAITRQPGAQDHDRGMHLVDHRLLVVGSIVHRRLFQQLEVLLAHAAIGAQPVFRHIFPFGAGGYAVIGPAFRFVVDQATDNTFPLAHVTSRSATAPVKPATTS